MPDSGRKHYCTLFFIEIVQFQKEKEKDACTHIRFSNSIDPTVSRSGFLFKKAVLALYWLPSYLTGPLVEYRSKLCENFSLFQ